MKNYIKPNTDIHELELQQAILDVSGPGKKEGEVNNDNDILGKESTFSIWSDSDEEE